MSKNVKVRTNNTVKSPIVYKIKNIGEVVIILEKRRNWTRIKFDGEDNKTYIGWVFTRYISRLIVSLY
ncbi:SH3 domain-containing protein [Clostridium tetani]|uniref:SH3 domain-containing protein n=1 Tax=Clostridium tetani TaxID=1513 RepID=UPI003BFA6B8A